MMDLAEFATSPQSTASITSLESLLSPPAAIEPIQKFLRFRLDAAQTMLLAVEDIAAVQTIPISDILPVPQMSPYVLGMSNWRGEALWLVDLFQQLGLKANTTWSGTTAERLVTVSAIVIQSGRKSLGLVVPEIDEIEEHNPDSLLKPSPDLFPQSISTFIKGYFKHDRSVVLDTTAVIQDPDLQIHQFNSF
ncbi:chemotaxis protein CheW [Leptolyngbya sp. AN03gr2]|uniref:chemotaxis protein CheW n=1 Tax=unclassified Leptolyngbya TaxID=2650499 RepID=UPI003D3164E7